MTDDDLVNRLLASAETADATGSPAFAEGLRRSAAEIKRLREQCEVRDAEIERLRTALTPSAETKAAYIGEFKFTKTLTLEDGEERTEPCVVPWTTIKEIMKAISARALVAQVRKRGCAAWLSHDE